VGFPGAVVAIAVIFRARTPTRGRPYESQRIRRGNTDYPIGVNFRHGVAFAPQAEAMRLRKKQAKDGGIRRCPPTSNPIGECRGGSTYSPVLPDIRI